jgi:hypothetical protein
MTVLIKDPDATLDYGVDWSGYLEDGEALSLSEWSVAPAGGLVLAGEANGASSATVQVAGGQRGHVCRLTNRVTTSLGRTDERSITIRMEQR